MNRSILIVICDFLLISLLAFSTVNINNVADDGAARPMRLTQSTTNQADSGKDLAAVMKLALEDERRKQQQLLSDLTRSHESLTQQQTLLTERERQAQALQQQLETRDQQAKRLQDEQAALQKQFIDAQTNIDALTQQLKGSTADALISKEKLAAMEAELRKQTEQATNMQQQLTQLAQSNSAVLSEKQLLAGQLRVAEIEKLHAAEQVTNLSEQVKIERQEKAQLAEGVKALATKSSELTKEIEDNQPLAANAIFNNFSTNRVHAHFTATRSGLLNTNRRKDAQTVLVTDGTNTWALCHVDDTPLTLFDPGTDWDTLSGSLQHDDAQVPVPSLSFHDHDPRIVLVPVSAADARLLGCKVYKVSADPFKFPDAVIVGASEGYYGECKLEVDLTTPGYARLDRNFLKGLFGKFNPSRGDLVFTRNGDLAGMMANGSYCLLLRDFDSSATFEFGPDVRNQHTGRTLARLYASIFRMPFKLQ
jgi:hypothetical protein